MVERRRGAVEILDAQHEPPASDRERAATRRARCAGCRRAGRPSVRAKRPVTVPESGGAGQGRRTVPPGRRRVHLGSRHAVRRLRGRGRSRTAVLHGVQCRLHQGGPADPAPAPELAPPGGHPMFDPVTGQLLSTLPPPPPRPLGTDAVVADAVAADPDAGPRVMPLAPSASPRPIRRRRRVSAGRSPKSTSHCGPAGAPDPSPGGGALGERRRPADDAGARRVRGL